MNRRGRPKLFPCCPECGQNTLTVTCTQQQGHCLNRWCECSSCGAHIRWVKAGVQSRWMRVREIKPPENTSASCL